MGSCQCESSKCPEHGDNCGKPATERVSPSYEMCGPCAARYREYMKGCGEVGLIDRDRKPECFHCGHAPVIWLENGSTVCPECGEVDKSMTSLQPHPDAAKWEALRRTSDTYARWDITLLGGGRAHMRSATNDDNDDGYPDADVTVWERDTKLSTAMKVAGGASRVGAYGQPVEVFIDGVRVIRFGPERRATVGKTAV